MHSSIVTNSQSQKAKANQFFHLSSAATMSLGIFPLPFLAVWKNNANCNKKYIQIEFFKSMFFSSLILAFHTNWNNPFQQKNIFTLFKSFLHSVHIISQESFHVSDRSNPNMRWTFKPLQIWQFERDCLL